MKYSHDYTLTQRDSTIARWKFAGDLTDASGNDLTLSTVNITAPVYSNGYSERGITALAIPSLASVTIPGVDANSLNPGMQSFTVECIVKCASGTSISLLDKHTGNGYLMYTISGAVTGTIQDVLTNIKSIVSSFNIADDKWHYISLCCDRENDELRIYDNGTASTTNPIDISNVVGNINPTDIAATIGGSTDAMNVDEVSMLIGEALTDNAVAKRAAGVMVPIMERDDDYFMNYLPAINHGNTDLEQLLSPFTSLYLETRLNSMQTGNAIMWHMAPNKFLDHLADTLGFQLIPMVAATENERRAFFPWVYWMNKRKGTLAAINKLLSLSGVTATIDENYSIYVPFRCNRDKTFDLSQVEIESHVDGFANINDWDSPLAGTWNVVGHELVGVGSGSDTPTNCILKDDTRTDFYISVQFDITNGFGAGAEFGLYLDYSTTSNWVRIEIRTVSSNDYIYLIKNDNGNIDERQIADISSIDHHTGTHTLWCHCDIDAGWYCIGINAQAYAREFAFLTAYTLGEKKGLWVNDSLEVTFDTYTVKRYQVDLAPHLVDTFSNNRKLYVTLTSATNNQALRYKYIHDVLPQFVPADVRIIWPVVVTDIGTLVPTVVAPTYYDMLIVTPSAESALVTNKVDPTVIAGALVITPTFASVRVASASAMIWMPTQYNHIVLPVRASLRCSTKIDYNDIQIT